MPVKLYKPNTPGRRHAGVLVRPKTKRSAKIKVKHLLIAKPFSGGRNNQGKITTRFRGGAVKRMVRLIDFKQDKFDVPARVLAIEYDPSRTAGIALVQYADGEKRYILAPKDMEIDGKVLCSHQQIPLNVGNRLPIKFIPAGLYIHNVELVPGGGGVLARSAGSWMLVMSQEGGWAQVKIPSGEIRLLSKDCLASIGQVSNIDHSNVRLGLAGRRRHKGFKPHVRGKAMNPVDHPHGGGEGHNPIGLKHPKTPWGKPALGVRTRSRTKWTNKFIISRRKKN